MRKTPAKELVRLRTGRDIPDLLQELYVDRRYNLTEIGNALGISRETVRLWLDEAGIQRPDLPPVEFVA